METEKSSGRPWPYPPNESITHDTAVAEGICREGVEEFLRDQGLKGRSSVLPGLVLRKKVDPFHKEVYLILTGRIGNGDGSNPNYGCHGDGKGNGYGESYGYNEPSDDLNLGNYGSDFDIDDFENGFGYGYGFCDGTGCGDGYGFGYAYGDGDSDIYSKN